jgi:hypothetical protein
MQEMQAAAPFTLPDGTQLRLRIPEIRELAPLTLLRDLRTPARLAQVLPLLFRAFTRTAAGEPPTLEQADAMAAAPQVATALLAQIQSLLDRWSEDGIAYAQCPGCRAWEADLTMPAVVILLAADLPPLFSGPFLEIPVLSQPLRTPMRPPEPMVASRIRTVLPSTRHGISTPFPDATLRAIEDVRAPAVAAPLFPGARESAAWDRWIPAGTEPQSPRRHWKRANAVFQAILRLSIAIDAEPANVDHMLAIDFYYLNALYALMYLTDVRDVRRATVTCERCATPFLPVG